MQLSIPKTREAKKLGVSQNQLVMADLCVIGYTESDAFDIAFQEYSTMNADAYRSMKAREISSAKFKRLFQTRLDAHKGSQAITDDSELMDKAQAARLIMKAAMKQDAGSKERIEGLMKYADLMGFKGNEVEDSSMENISFFFPLKCNQCPLLMSYNEAMKERGEKEIRPVEMGRVIERAKAVIDKTSVDEKPTDEEV